MAEGRHSHYKDLKETETALEKSLAPRVQIITLSCKIMKLRLLRHAWNNGDDDLENLKSF